MDPSSTLMFATLFLVVVLASVGVALWRLRRHAARRADAERRMGEALAELERLTTRLRAQQREIEATAAAATAAARRGEEPPREAGA